VVGNVLNAGILPGSSGLAEIQKSGNLSKNAAENMSGFVINC